MSKPPRFRTIPATNCPRCSKHDWRDDSERARLVERIIELDREVRQLRAEPRRLDVREFHATARDLAWLIDQLVDEQGRPIDARNATETLERIRFHARRLTSDRRNSA